MELYSLWEVPAFQAADGATVRELAGRSTGLASHSLAHISHPAGTASRAHHHLQADELYLVQDGSARLECAGEIATLGPGDAALIRPGQRHKIWSEGPGELVLLVTCSPAYDPSDVVWDE